MHDVRLSDYAVFFAMTALTVWSALRATLWADERRKHYRNPRASVTWDVVARSVVGLVCYLVAYQRAEFGWVWLALAISGLASQVIVFSSVAVLDANRDEFERAEAARRRQTPEPWQRWLVLADVATLALWVYAWRHLFGR